MLCLIATWLDWWLWLTGRMYEYVIVGAEGWPLP